MLKSYQNAKRDRGLCPPLYNNKLRAASCGRMGWEEEGTTFKLSEYSELIPHSAGSPRRGKQAPNGLAENTMHIHIIF